MNKIRIVFVMYLAFALGLPMLAVHAEPVGLKWRAGQVDKYALHFDGTLNLTLSESPVGVLPLELLLDGKGKVRVRIQEVDDTGAALLVPSVERMQVGLSEPNYNQAGRIDIENGSGSIYMGDQLVSGPHNWALLAKPAQGFRVTRQGVVLRSESFVLHDGAEKPLGEEQEDQFTQLDDSLLKFLSEMAVVGVPLYLPDGEMEVGREWKVDFVKGDMKSSSREPSGTGTFAFKALSRDDLAGKSAWKIAVSGSSTMTNVALGSSFCRSRESLVGTIWIAPETGSFVKADLQLVLKGTGEKDRNDDFDYKGTVRLDSVVE